MPLSFLSRRRFLYGCAAAAAAPLAARGLGVQHRPSSTGRRPAAAWVGGGHDVPGELVDPTLLKQLALAAVDAAKAAGVQYADVRLTRMLAQDICTGASGGFAQDEERLGVGVRCLVDGYWGFAASAVWTRAEVAALAQSAAAMARVNAQASRAGGRGRPIEWTPLPAVTGDWTMPVEIDPFTVSLEEKFDCAAACHAYVQDSGPPGWLFERQEQALASTEGTYVTQTTYYSRAALWVRLRDAETGLSLDAPFHGVMPGGRGWELVRDTHYLAQLPEWQAVREEVQRVPMRAAELGRYDLIVDGWTAAALLDKTLGRATQLDRALGYEANAGGTSYLGSDPLALLGTFQAAAPLVTVTADRSMPGGLATVRWDAEGVDPEEIPLIKDGVLVDYQTTREQAGWLRPYYEKAGKPVRSHGHAGAESALALTQQQSPNLGLVPGATPVGLSELIAGTKKGLLLQWGDAASDFQAKTGSVGAAYCREIVNGKLGAFVQGATALFTATDLWKSVSALGPLAEAQTVDAAALNGWAWPSKGEPGQGARYSVRAVPVKFTNVTISRG